MNLNNSKYPSFKIFFFRVCWILVVDTVSKSFTILFPFLGIFKDSQCTYLGQMLDKIWSKSTIDNSAFYSPFNL